MTRTALPLTVNGRARKLEAEPRTSLADALRDRLDLTGTHLGCEQGACGACTVLLDGVPVGRGPWRRRMQTGALLRARQEARP